MNPKDTHHSNEEKISENVDLKREIKMKYSLKEMNVVGFMCVALYRVHALINGLNCCCCCSCSIEQNVVRYNKMQIHEI